MGAEMTVFFATIAVGLGATLFMDLWALLLNRALNVASPGYCMVGRWISHMPEGTFRHANIVAAACKPAECAVGWIAHYIVGVAYAFMLVGVASERWLAQPTLLPALLFGVGTVLMPLLVMQPAFGFGIASSKASNPVEARVRSLMAHCSFGVGVFVSAVGARHLLSLQL